MDADGNQTLRHQLDFTLYNLPSTTIRIDFPTAAGAENILLTAMPTIRLGASYTPSPVTVSNLFVQPRRIECEISNAPSLLPISLQITCGGPFVFGWLLVPESVQTVIATAVQRIRIVGPGYWALPLRQAGATSEPKPNETVPPRKSGTAPAKPAGEVAAT
ncbi:MAG TPA: hypothetical protein VNU97_07580 [Rhizomicrobium sp.]|jgi:hypothetical protein|nr:hypothetical protein [Rhizomicrobium sp.]